MNNKLKFKISSNLKNIIGRELITDDFIAVFELVKNAYDAHASEVTITFEEDRLTISDNGKGMDYDDLINKWLFVAYSAKSLGKEDKVEELNEFEEFKEKINEKSFFAGAKGIGRFSCDKLGDKLVLFTKKAKKDSKVEKLEINWKDFEEDAINEFIEIPVKHETLDTKDGNLKFKHGTILQISVLASEWNREKILKLKHSLEKLINPFEISTDNKTITNNFSIIINSEKDIILDKKENNQRKKINGPIKNFTFKILGLKTTQILTEIDPDGDYITTILTDRGTKIYEIKEKNKLTPLLKNIKFNLYFLNQAAKINFVKQMGIPVVQFGSVFLFRNGIRVYPFGEVGEDSLKIDRRKQQGYARYLGTRDLLGSIEIIDKEGIFQEATSRDGGLIRTPIYDELEKVFFEKCLKRLESYVVDIQWKIKEIRKIDKFQEDTYALNNIDSKTAILDLILKVANASKDLVDFWYNTEFLNLIKERINDNSPQTIDNLKSVANKINNPELLLEVQKFENYYKKIEKEKIEIEELAKKGDEARKLSDEKLEQIESQNLFLKSLATRDFDQIVNILHQIGISANTIETLIYRILKKYNNATLNDNKFLLEIIEKIDFENRKILSFANFVTKANFKPQEVTIEDDIISFISQYLQNTKDQYNLNIIINRYDELPYKIKFKPIEILIILDNLLSNSKKHYSKNINISFSVSNVNEIIIKYLDDGLGLNEKIRDPNLIFEKGFTTSTTGSGLGLYHVKQIINSMRGEISVNPKVEKGLEFNIRLTK